MKVACWPTPSFEVASPHPATVSTWHTPGVGVVLPDTLMPFVVETVSEDVGEREGVTEGVTLCVREGVEVTLCVREGVEEKE